MQMKHISLKNVRKCAATMLAHCYPFHFYIHLDLFITPLHHGFGYTTGHCLTPVWLFLLYVYTFYSRYNTDWIANTEIGLDPNNSVIKRLWCTTKERFVFLFKNPVDNHGIPMGIVTSPHFYRILTNIVMSQHPCDNISSHN